MSIPEIYECNVHNNPSVSLVDSCIPICVKVR
nr:MAG TPA: hypothetical protein [Caudoviricetes sp.]